MFVRAIKCPWGEKTQAGIFIVRQAIGAWALVTVVPESRIVEGRVVDSEYRVGDAVYLPKTALEVLGMGEDTVAIAHESLVKAVIRAGDFVPELVDRSAATLLAESTARQEAAGREELVTARAVPGNGRMLEV